MTTLSIIIRLTWLLHCSADGVRWQHCATLPTTNYSSGFSHIIITFAYPFWMWRLGKKKVHKCIPNELGHVTL